MFSILSLFGVALAAAMWPDAKADDDDTPQTARDVDSEGDRADALEVLGDADAAGLSEADFGDDLITDPFFEELIGSAEADILIGTDGDDHIMGGFGQDVLQGGAGNDMLDGTDDDQQDELIGGEGHDQIWLGADDKAVGGAGDDEFYVGAAEAAFIADYNPDNDRIIFEYDETAPAPRLEQQDSDDGIRLIADGKHVATFGGNAQFDVSKVHLKAVAA